jgi:hypothetical protein
MQRRYDEFSISLLWRKSDKGSYPRPSTEGYHLTMGWANEGEADWIANRQLITLDQFENIVEAVGTALHWDLIPTAVEMSKQAAQRNRERIVALRKRQEEIAAELLLLEDVI